MRVNPDTMHRKFIFQSLPRAYGHSWELDCRLIFWIKHLHYCGHRTNLPADLHFVKLFNYLSDLWQRVCEGFPLIFQLWGCVCWIQEFLKEFHCLAISVEVSSPFLLKAAWVRPRIISELFDGFPLTLWDEPSRDESSFMAFTNSLLIYWVRQARIMYGFSLFVLSIIIVHQRVCQCLQHRSLITFLLQFLSVDGLTSLHSISPASCRIPGDGTWRTYRQTPLPGVPSSQ